MTNNNTNDFEGFLDMDVSDEDFFSLEEKPAVLEEDQDTPPTPPTDEEEVEEDGDDDDEEDKPATPGSSLATLNLLKEKGIISFELEEGKVLNEREAEEMLEDAYDNSIEERIEDLFENSPPILKELNKFVLKGGNIEDFFATIETQNSDSIKADMDMEEESNQITVVKHSLKEEGYDDEYIEAQIEFLKDSKRLKKHAETHYSKWDTKRQKQQLDILKSQDDKVKAEKAQKRALKEKVVTYLEDKEEVTGFTISKQDKKDLPNYMSERVVKLDNGHEITEMQKDLMRVLASPTGSVQIAKLLKKASEQGELNFEDIIKDTQTKVTTEIRNDVRRNKNSIVAGAAGGKTSKRKRHLAAYFD